MAAILNVNRTGYSLEQIYGTMTVGELISRLQEFDENEKVYFASDDHYTFGEIRHENIEWMDENKDYFNRI